MSVDVEIDLPTAVDLLARPDAEHFELVGGRLVEKPIGAESGWSAESCSLA